MIQVADSTRTTVQVGLEVYENIYFISMYLFIYYHYHLPSITSY